MTSFIQDPQQATGRAPADRQPEAWRKRGLVFVRAVIGVALVGDGASHIWHGLHEFGGGYRHAALGAFLVAAGLLALLDRARRLRKSEDHAARAGDMTADDPSTPLRLHVSRRVSTRMIIGSALMCAAAFAILFFPLVAPRPRAGLPLAATLPIGLLGVLFFGACLLWLVQRRLDAGDALVADGLGLLDRSNALGSPERIPWRAIRNIRAVRFLNQQFVVVELIRPEGYIDQAHGLRRLMLRANRRLVGSPWCISPGTLGWSASKLADRLEARRSHYLASN
jgi:hypothetical protein